MCSQRRLPTASFGYNRKAHNRDADFRPLYDPMSRRRLFVPPDQIHDGMAELPPDQTHRLREVLRLGKDREIEVFDGKGNAYLGRVDFAGHHPLVVDLKPIAGREFVPPRLVVAAAIVKPARFEWMLEKATELDADEFIPLITRYSDTRLAKANLHPRIERWRRIVRQACEQCRRAMVPEVRFPLTFLDLLAMENLSGFTKLLCYENGGVPLAKEKVTGPIVLCIGPEGGWDSREIDAALMAGYKLVSLGHNILRAETSVIAAVTLLRIAGCGSRTAE